SQRRSDDNSKLAVRGERDRSVQQQPIHPDLSVTVRRLVSIGQEQRAGQAMTRRFSEAFSAARVNAALPVAAWPLQQTYIAHSAMATGISGSICRSIL